MKRNITTMRSLEERAGRSELKPVAMLDIYDVQVHPEASRAIKDRYGIADGTNENAFFEAVTPEDFKALAEDPYSERYERAYKRILKVFTDGVRSGDLETTLLEGTAEGLKGLKSAGLALGCFSTGTEESVVLPLQKFALLKYYENPDLIVPVMAYGYQASKSQPETFIQLAQDLREKGYKLTIFADDNKKYVKAAVVSGAVRPEGAYHIQKGYSGEVDVEEEGIRFRRVSNLQKLSETLQIREETSEAETRE